LRLFVASASELVTDHRGHGEGLISWSILSEIVSRGHEVVACTRTADLRRPPPFDVIEVGSTSRFESLAGLSYARRATSIFLEQHGRAPFDAALWMFPQGEEHILWSPPVEIPFVIGPLAPAFPMGRGRSLSLGDAVTTILKPFVARRHRRVMRSAAALVLSIPDARRALPRGVSGNIVVAPLGVTPSAFTPSPLPEQPTIAYVGRLERNKGINDLVTAFTSVRDRLPEARLIVAGDGPERAGLDALAASGERSIDVRGHVPHHQIADVLRECAVFCLPSHGEGYGMAIVEAMACGRAVVSTPSGGPAFLVDDGVGGLLVPPGEPSLLADALVQLLEDRGSLESMGAHNRARVEAELNWTQCAATIDGGLRTVTA
jgi:glycosyltransferase involved in cell wall biosynthesis